jgi:hypothetical protein
MAAPSIASTLSIRGGAGLGRDRDPHQPLAAPSPRIVRRENPGIPAGLPRTSRRNLPEVLVSQCLVLRRRGGTENTSTDLGEMAQLNAQSGWPCRPEVTRQREYERQPPESRKTRGSFLPPALRERCHRLLAVGSHPCAPRYSRRGVVVASALKLK